MLLAAAASIQAVAVAVLAAAVGNHPGRPARDGLIVLLAVAMGLQNAVARRLAVPDLTTTVLTLTAGGLLALHVSIAAPLAAAAVVLGAIAVVTRRLDADAPWASVTRGAG